MIEKLPSKVFSRDAGLTSTHERPDSGDIANVAGMNLPDEQAQMHTVAINTNMEDLDFPPSIYDPAFLRAVVDQDVMINYKNKAKSPEIERVSPGKLRNNDGQMESSN